MWDDVRDAFGRKPYFKSMSFGFGGDAKFGQGVTGGAEGGSVVIQFPFFFFLKSFFVY